MNALGCIGIIGIAAGIVGIIVAVRYVFRH